MKVQGGALKVTCVLLNKKINWEVFLLTCTCIRVFSQDLPYHMIVFIITSRDQLNPIRFGENLVVNISL